MPKVKTTKVTKKKALGAVKAPKKVTKKLDYSLEVSVNDLVYKGEAADMKQALADFVSSPVFPFAIKTKVFVKYSKGDTEMKQVYHVPEARRVFKMIAMKDSALDILAYKLTQNLS